MRCGEFIRCASNAGSWLQRGQFCNETRPLAFAAMFRHKTDGGSNARKYRDQGRSRSRPSFAPMQTVRCQMNHVFPRFARVLAFASVHMLTPAWGQTHDASMDGTALTMTEIAKGE